LSKSAPATHVRGRVPDLLRLATDVRQPTFPHILAKWTQRP
jgi:hypothetical protein